ncbi:hypothetical protein A2U01_0084932, partial [Trifolium medium]|nr:hypothetical protein [Trifolium medium]
GLSASCSEQEHCLVIPSRIIDLLYQARALARYAEHKGIWASSWPRPEQESPQVVVPRHRSKDFRF